MKILLANDDGIDAKGIHALIHALKEDYELYVCAPVTQRSGYSHSVTYFAKDNRFEIRNIPGVKKAWAADATPADCVYYGIYAMMDEKPDLVISGINQGENLSDDVLYSGTIGAACEALIAGIPAMAVSLCSYESDDFSASAEIACNLIPVYMQGRKDYVMSINVPPLPYKDIKGYRICRSEKGRNYAKHVSIQSLEDHTCILHTDNTRPHMKQKVHAGSDVDAVANGYVSLTPIGLSMDYIDRSEDLHSLIRNISADSRQHML